MLYLIDGLGSGGAQRQLVTLVNGLDRAIVQPEVALYHPVLDFVPELAETSTPVHQLGVRGGRDPRVALRLRALIREQRFDIVHSYLRTPGVLARLVTLGSTLPKIVVSERSTDLGHSAVRLLVERMLAERGDSMIVNAETIGRHVEGLIPSWQGRISVIHNGISWDDVSDDQIAQGERFRGRYVSGTDELLLGVVARLSAEKNPHLLLDALLRLPESSAARLRVIWIGACRDRGLMSSVRERLAATGWDRRVHLLPATRTTETRSVYLAIDGLVLPSNREGFPNAVLEALAHGRPVIATDVGDARLLVDHGKTGWVIPSSDPDALAAAIGEFADTPADKRRRMGEMGSAFVLKEYSVERLVERTLDVYFRVLGKTGAAVGTS